MVDFNPNYLKKHPEVAAGLLLPDSRPVAGYQIDVSKLVAHALPGSWIRVAQWRKHWQTGDARIREELLAHVNVLLYADENQVLSVPLRNISTLKWCPLPVPGALLLRLPVRVLIALKVRPPCTLDPRGLVAVEIKCERFKKEK